jgi:transposase
VSGNSELFVDLPEQRVPEAPIRGMPRLRQPERHQLGWQVATIDDLVARDHPVRAVWAFVQGLDLRALHDAVKAREGVPGQAPPEPELMMALWLWATVDGVGSARQLARLCEQHLAYRWLCGGMSMNYHTLSDFRVAHVELLDRLLAGGVAALVEEGLVALGAARLDHRCRGAGDETGRWRVSASPQHADHLGAESSGRRRGRHPHQRLGSRPGTPGAGRVGRCRDAAVGLPGGWRVHQKRRHRMGSCERHQTVVLAGAEQASH